MEGTTVDLSLSPDATGVASIRVNLKSLPCGATSETVNVICAYLAFYPHVFAAVFLGISPRPTRNQSAAQRGVAVEFIRRYHHWPKASTRPSRLHGHSPTNQQVRMKQLYLDFSLILFSVC